MRHYIKKRLKRKKPKMFIDQTEECLTYSEHLSTNQALANSEYRFIMLCDGSVVQCTSL